MEPADLDTGCVRYCSTGTMDELELANTELSVPFIERGLVEVIEAVETGTDEAGTSEVDNNATLLVGQGVNVGTVDWLALEEVGCLITGDDGVCGLVVGAEIGEEMGIDTGGETVVVVGTVAIEYVVLDTVLIGQIKHFRVVNVTMLVTVVEPCSTTSGFGVEVLRTARLLVMGGLYTEYETLDVVLTGHQKHFRVVYVTNLVTVTDVAGWATGSVGVGGRREVDVVVSVLTKTVLVDCFFVVGKKKIGGPLVTVSGLVVEPRNVSILLVIGLEMAALTARYRMDNSDCSSGNCLYSLTGASWTFDYNGRGHCGDAWVSSFRRGDQDDRGDHSLDHCLGTSWTGRARNRLINKDCGGSCGFMLSYRLI